MESQKILRILLLEGIHPVAADRLRAVGFDVVQKRGALDEGELRNLILEFDAVGLRSKTQITSKILEEAKHLKVIGAFCIGTNQIDTLAANKLGIPVFNAPYSNTRSVAELIICEMIALARQLGDRNRSTHQGLWDKSATGSREVRGKTVGIVGYGHIGSQVSILAEAMGLKVIFFDIVKKLPLGNSKSVDSLEELLKNSDFVTLHVPATKETHKMISKRELSLMKRGSFLINASRGSVVVIEDLVESLKGDLLGGAAIDVFPEEPNSKEEHFSSQLQGVSNVILTPHIGGSTEEAQEAIGNEVAESFIRYLRSGVTSGAVNFPNVDLPVIQNVHRVINIHHNVPGVLKEINGIVSSVGANITAQYLSTDAHIGYMVMDLEKAEAQSVNERVRKLSTSIRTRILY